VAVRRVIFPIVLLAIAGCRTSETPVAPVVASPAAPASPEAAASAAPTPPPFIPGGGAATLQGRVVFDGDPPATISRASVLDPALCGVEPKIDRGLVVDPATKGIQYVVVTLDASGAPPGSSLPADPAVDQARCEYYPFLTLLRPGGQLRVTNSDDGLHDVHRVDGDGHTEHFAAPPGIANTLRFDHPDRVHLSCDLHYTASAWVIVTDAAFATNTGADGSFAIPSVPSGWWLLRAWNERVGETTRLVQIPASGTAMITIAMSSPASPRAAPATPAPNPAPTPRAPARPKPSPSPSAR
jgi:plastocyanin